MRTCFLTLLTLGVTLGWRASLLCAEDHAPASWQPYRDAQIGLSSSAQPVSVTPIAEGNKFSIGFAAGDAPSMPDLPGGGLTDGALMPADYATAFVNPELACGCAVCCSPPGYCVCGSHLWQWRLLPEGVMWHSYWAGAREPRISGAVFSERNGGALLDVTLGGRQAILRYGTDDPGRPEGWEFGIEGAALPRLNLDQNWDLDSVDFRFGLPVVYARDNWQWKFSYYHLSAHLGDELIVRDPARLAERINYSRDALVLGFSYYPLPAWRWYAETGWAFYTDGGSKPWEFQFGVDVAAPGPTDICGTPFFAINGHLREENNFGGNLVVQAGWLWRGTTGRVIRTGFHYYNGKSSQFEFFDNFEHQIGGGVWAEF